MGRQNDFKLGRSSLSSTERPWFWASMVTRILRRRPPVSTMRRCSSTLSICQRGHGEDLRALPLCMRKANLARLLRGRPDGIFQAPFEQGKIGPDLFRKTCEFGLEGLVSKHQGRAYRPGLSPNWLKIKNPTHPAIKRVKEAFP